MHAMRNKCARVDRAVVLRRRNEAHLRYGFLRHVAEIHSLTGGQSNLFNTLFQLDVSFESFGRFMSGFAEIRGTKNDDRHAVVDAGDLHAVDDIDGGTRR